jgi:hypothetical protein
MVPNSSPCIIRRVHDSRKIKHFDENNVVILMPWLVWFCSLGRIRYRDCK